MFTRKILRKFKIAYHLLKDQGVLAVAVRTLEFAKKKTGYKRSSAQSTLTNNPGRIYTGARYEDILEADLNDKKRLSKKSVGKNTKAVFAWIMPPPGKGSGGHLNIFRFIGFLEDAGYMCEIYMFVNGEHGSAEGVKAVMGDSYPDIKAAKKMFWLDPGTSLDHADAIFATSWETAYASYRLPTSAKRFYFVQDFEPYFYPVGGLYTLAENTYKMGFYGVTAGGWLKKKLTSEFAMKADSFDFGTDSSTYSLTNSKKRKEIFYYARPYTARRGFEVGVLALDIFHKMHPDYIINFVGWDVSEYDIPFPHRNLKTLEVSELSGLYNKCAAGLVLSYTNMSLLPLELLSCGTIPVVNSADNNRLVSDNAFIAYAENDPHSLANELSKIVTRKDQIEYAKQASEAAKQLGWEASGKKFISIVEKELYRG